MKSQMFKVREGINKSILACLDNPISLRDNFSLIDDLSFDSSQMAALTLCLEEELNMEIQLNDWLSMANRTSELTIESLVRYINKFYLVNEI